MISERPITIHRFLRAPNLALGVFALGIIVIGAAGLFGAVRRLPTTIPNDFHMYYVEGWVVNHGLPLYRDEYMAYAAGQIGVASIGYGYPPFFAALMRPLAILPLDVASWLWLLGNVACVFLMVWMLARLFQLSRTIFLVLCGAVLLMPSVYDTFLFGQINLWLTLLFVGAMILGAREKNRHAHIVAGILMGIAIATKVYPALLLIVFVLYRRYTVLLATVVTVLLTFAIGIVYGGGWDATFLYWGVIVPAQSALVTFPADQSATAVLARLFQPSYFPVPLSPEETLFVQLEPWWNNPGAGRVLWYGFVALVIGVTAFALWRIRRTWSKQQVLNANEFPTNMEFVISLALVLTAMLLVLPHVWDHYLAHLILPLVVLVSYTRVWIEKWRFVFVLELAFFFLLLHRYWAWILRFVESPWLMLFGFAGTLLVWVALLLVFVRYSPPSAITSFTFSRR